MVVQNCGDLEIGAAANITYTTLAWLNGGFLTDKGGVFAALESGIDLVVPITSRIYDKVVKTYNSLTANGGFVLDNYDMATNVLVITTDVIVGANGLLSHGYNSTTQANVLNIQAVNLTVNGGGQIDVSGRGFQYSAGPGGGNDDPDHCDGDGANGGS